MSRAGFVRLVIDGNGYRVAADLEARHGVTYTTLWRWGNAGAVRSLKRGRHRYYREADVELLTSLPAEMTRAMGISRVPAEVRAYARRWLDQLQDRTRATADRYGEPWDVLEDVLVLDWDGRVEDLAVKLGRTYAAVLDRRFKLHQVEEVAS